MPGGDDIVTKALTKFRFTHDGSVPSKPQLLDLETGNDVAPKFSIESMTYNVNARDIPTVTLNLFAFETDVKANAVWQTRNPMTGEYEPLAAMEFRDGSRVVFDEDGMPSYERVKPSNAVPRKKADW